MVVNNRYDKGKVSFCVLGYKHVKFLEDCIRSIWDIDYANKEIIAIDDGSNDGSVELLNKLKNESKCDFTVIAQENSGFIGLNFNRALEKATGEYVSFISLDDFYDSREMNEVIKEIIDTPETAFIACTKIQGVNQDTKDFVCIEPLKVDELENPSIEDLSELVFDNFCLFYIQGCIFRKEVVDAINGYDEDIFGDDIILQTKIFNYLKIHKDYNFKFHRMASVFYRQHENNISKNGVKMMKFVSEYLERYWPDRGEPELFYNWYRDVMNSDNFMQLKRMNKKMEKGYYKIMEDTDFITRIFFQVYRDFMNNSDKQKLKDLKELYKDIRHKNTRMRLINFILSVPFGISFLKRKSEK